MKKLLSNELIIILRRIIKKKNDIDKIPYEFGTGIPLYHAELHLLDLIVNNEGQSVSDIAKINNVTKGAISQTLKKLVDKGLVIKNTDPNNITRTLLFLSKKGKTALESHIKWHDNINHGFNEYVYGLDQKQVQTIKEFLTKYEFFIDKHLE